MQSRAWSFVAGSLLLGAIAASGCGNGGGSEGIPCSGPEHCSSYGLVCSDTLLVCVECNTSSDCNGAVCVNAVCQAGAGGNGGTFSTGGQGGSGLVAGNGGVSGSISSGGVSGSIGSGASGGTGGSEPICDSSTPNGLSDCCPDVAYPWWCWHAYSGYGNCFAYGVDCSTVTVCAPETFARACQPGNQVVCASCLGGNYGYCYPSEGCL